jgi:CRP-like cAMP-binding protein
LWDAVVTRCGSAGIMARSQSQAVVTVVTARLGGIWHKRCIMSVGEQSLILEASDLLKICLAEIGKKEHLSAADILFCEDGDNAGVFLVVGGTVCMSVKSLPRLDRLFGSGSLLGLPSSFTGRPYTLTATAITEADVMHVSREDFLLLMLERPDLCGEATEMLGREMTFIQSALAERQRQVGSARTSSDDLAVV